MNSDELKTYIAIEVSKILNLHVETVRKMLREGKIRSFKASPCSSYIISHMELTRLLNPQAKEKKRPREFITIEEADRPD